MGAEVAVKLAPAFGFGFADNVTSANPSLATGGAAGADACARRPGESSAVVTAQAMRKRAARGDEAVKTRVIVTPFIDLQSFATVIRYSHSLQPFASAM
jgi:hypothetical protein